MGGKLGQGLGFGDAHRYRNAGPLLDGGANFVAIVAQVGFSEPVQTQEGFVDGILLDLWAKVLKGLDHPARHVFVEHRVGGKGVDNAPVHQILDRVQRCLHGHQRFSFGRSRDDTPVVVGEHHHGLAFQVWAEDLFTGSEKTIAVYQGKHSETLEVKAMRAAGR